MTDDTPCDPSTGMLPGHPMARCPQCGRCSYLVGSGWERCLSCTGTDVLDPPTLVPTPLDTTTDDEPHPTAHSDPTESHNDPQWPGTPVLLPPDAGGG